MSEIVLATINAKYLHASFGLRYLRANLGDLRDASVIIEFDLAHKPADMVEAILAHEPKIVGLGIYIWNAVLSLEVVRLIKAVRPDLTVVLGGPEVSYEANGQEICLLADYTVSGEADLAFRELCQKLLAGERPASRWVTAPVPDLALVAMPYDLYTDEDVAHRLVYVEASRGCAFTCEFCLSSLDIPVRQLPITPFLAEMDRLYQRGVQQFKFVDRTFNLNLNTSRAILEFFLQRLRPGLFLHFEMIPDRLPDGLRDLIRKFPAGTLQFEVGIQSFNDEVSQRIKRRQNLDRLADNFRFLRSETGVHIHADLIVGLPGETIESFGQGFDRLIALQPQEIQVGILKRLRGTPIVRHDQTCAMLYSQSPPYELLSNQLIDFRTMQRLKRFSRYWDLVGNSGNFVEAARLLWAPDCSPFAEFMRWSDWLFTKIGRTHAIALADLAALLFEFLTTVQNRPASEVGQVLWRDYQKAGRSDRPIFLRPFIPVAEPGPRQTASDLPRRQRRHANA